eukprot:jgi/Astpho2/195/fgenesh1_pg.00009_%23_1_t
MIDRNDELCILYEKANIQEEVMKKGQMALQRREDEIRLLRLEVAEMVRAVEVPKRLLPIIPGVDLDITCIKTQLLETRRQAEELALQLESPANKERWRRLEGKIPDREELCAKISQLEERLHGRREALLEKDLILEELGGLSDRLRSLAAEGREDTLCLAQKALSLPSSPQLALVSAPTVNVAAHSLQVNDFQVRLRSVTRRMMATVSELSMWQATGIKLGAQQQELEVLLAEAMQRLEACHGSGIIAFALRLPCRMPALQALQQPAGLCTVYGPQQCIVACRDCGRPLIDGPCCSLETHVSATERPQLVWVVEAGEPPTEDAEREWQRILRERQQLADMREQAQLLRQAQEEQDTAVPSMAEGRPNAYIPEDLGIPKPYGGFAPFKPSEAGSTMRHIQLPLQHSLACSQSGPHEADTGPRVQDKGPVERSGAARNSGQQIRKLGQYMQRDGCGLGVTWCHGLGPLSHVQGCQDFMSRVKFVTCNSLTAQTGGASEQVRLPACAYTCLSLNSCSVALLHCLALFSKLHLLFEA